MKKYRLTEKAVKEKFDAFSEDTIKFINSEITRLMGSFTREAFERVGFIYLTVDASHIKFKKHNLINPSDFDFYISLNKIFVFYISLNEIEEE